MSRFNSCIRDSILDCRLFQVICSSPMRRSGWMMWPCAGDLTLVTGQSSLVTVPEAGVTKLNNVLAPRFSDSISTSTPSFLSSFITYLPHLSSLSLYPSLCPSLASLHAHSHLVSANSRPPLPNHREQRTRGSRHHPTL